MVFQVRAEVDSHRMLKKQTPGGSPGLVNVKVYAVSLTADFAYLHDLERIAVYDPDDQLVYFGRLTDNEDKIDHDLLNSLAQCVPRKDPYSHLEQFTEAKAGVFWVTPACGTITLEAKIAYSKPSPVKPGEEQLMN